MYLSQVPGYNRICARADRLEDAWRDRAFIDANDKICGVEVRLITLRMFIELNISRNPFLVGGTVGREHVAAFFWRLSPQYLRPSEYPDTAAGEPTPRERFVEMLIATVPFRRSVRAINRFLNRMLIDKPPSSGSATDAKADTSFAASAVHQLAAAYGWDEDKILDMPMPRMFQYLRKIHREKDPGLAYFNPIRDGLTKKLKAKARAKVQAQLDARKLARAAAAPG
jgi:hypothetical protein